MKDIMTKLNEQQNFMPVEVLRAQIVRVVRRDEGDARIPGDAHQGLVDQGLLGKRVRHDLMGYYLIVLLGKNGPLGRWLETIFGVTFIFTWQRTVINSDILCYLFRHKNIYSFFYH